ncbi:Uncharacterised protein [uncultured archaeon]|nr:Uncharacterised protein [uncultured archaeon]
MQVPEFIKEVVWSFYPPRYHQLADKPFTKSLWYMSKVLLIAFILAGVLFVPRLFLLKDNIESELSKFDTFTLSGNITQSAPVAIPKHNPWVVVDLNANLTMTKEIFVIDKDTFKYRFISPKSIPREQLKDFSANKPRVSSFLSAILVMMLPGIALLLYVRMWLKYFLMVLVFGTFFFIVMELSRYRLHWKQMLNIAAHALTAVILVEVIAAAVSTVFLIPIMRFLGLNVYAITTLAFACLIVLGIVGYYIEDYRRKR